VDHYNIHIYIGIYIILYKRVCLIYYNNKVVGVGWLPDVMREGVEGGGFFPGLTRIPEFVEVFAYIFAPFPRRPRRADKKMRTQYIVFNKNKNEKTKHEPKRKSSRW